MCDVMRYYEELAEVKGEARGLAKGKAEGRAEERASIRERMISLGMSPADIEAVLA